MPYFNRTYRIQDGEGIDGSWRHVFINNGSIYFLTDLKVYADGMIECWGLVDFAMFQRKGAPRRFRKGHRRVPTILPPSVWMSRTRG